MRTVTISTILSLILLKIAYTQEPYQLILKHGNSDISMFNVAVRNTGLENENNPTANTWSIIGKLKPTDYVAPDNYYYFMLIYDNCSDGVKYTLTWKQTSWLTATHIAGFQAINIPPQTLRRHVASVFKGLGLSNHDLSYLDGDAHSHSHWFNSVGTIHRWTDGYGSNNGWNGVPGFNEKVAKSVHLYVCKGSNKCVGLGNGEGTESSCEQGTDYLFRGVPCVASGDPHFITWGNSKHDFQGQPRTGKNQFYYIAPCDGSDNDDMPFNLLGTHYNWGNRAVSGLEYITFELFDDNDDEYVIFLSANIHSYRQKVNGVKTLYDDNIGNVIDLISGSETNIGNRFKITYTQTSGNRIDVILRIDNKCDIKLYMQGQTNIVNNRYRMHLLVIQPPECYRCFGCGLCGNFRTLHNPSSSWQSMETCFGESIPFQPGWTGNNLFAYDINGNSWEKQYYDANCVNNSQQNGNTQIYTPGPIPSIPDPCDGLIKLDVKNACQTARNAKQTCCNSIGGDFCNDLQSDCELDACVQANGDKNAIPSAVQTLFTDAVDLVCTIPGEPFKPTPPSPPTQPIDCKVSNWINDGKCSEFCGGGKQKQIRVIIQEEKNGGNRGTDCNNLQQEIACNIHTCPCSNNNGGCIHGVCVNEEGGFSCNCNDGYNGQFCNQDIDECAINNGGCINGICENQQGGFICNCNNGYKGKYCNEDINECTENTDNCNKYATCKNTDGSFECQCNEYFQGNGVDCSCVGNIGTFDWDNLLEKGKDDEIPDFNYLMNINKTDLSLNIRVELEYLGKTSADNKKDPLWGTTYVLDFESFDAHKDNIYEPGTCQNRRGNDFFKNDGVTLKDFDEWWTYSQTLPLKSSDIGNINSLSYPPTNINDNGWDISIGDDDSCGYIVYEGRFTWQDLRDCNNGKIGNDLKEYTMVKQDENWLNLTGTFYINVVSPFDYKQNFGYYRVYQLLSQPFIISVSKTVYVLGKTGINLLTMSIIAVYKENNENTFRLIVLTESANYLKLSRISTDLAGFEPLPNGGSIEKGNFIAITTSVTADQDNGNSAPKGCLNNKQYLCSQLWEIRAENIKCDKNKNGIDFSGKYTLTFNTECRDNNTDPFITSDLNNYCDKWLINHPNIDNGVALETNLVWKDMYCDPKVFKVQFNAEMQFYTDLEYKNKAKSDQLYQVGEGIIYVEIITKFPTNTYKIFDTKLVNVWICTFPPSYYDKVKDPNPDKFDGGCYDSNRDGGLTDNNKYFYHIYRKSPLISEEKFNLIGHPDNTNDNKNKLRFYFTVPNKIARDKLYIHAQIEVSLTEENNSNQPRRRTLLMKKEANQIKHFLGSINIDNGKNGKKKKRQEKPVVDNNHNNNYKPSEPINYNPTSTEIWTINLSSPWVIVIGGFLSIILLFNIGLIFYMNCCQTKQERNRVSFNSRRRSGYSSVKNIDNSEYDDSECNPINV